MTVRGTTDYLTFPDKEAADTAAREKAKADKIKLGEDRHKQNVEALANLQKALVSTPSTVNFVADGLRMA